MTALNETFLLWNKRLVKAACLGEVGSRAGGVQEGAGILAPLKGLRHIASAFGPEQEGPNCCWVICNICCWVKC